MTLESELRHVLLSTMFCAPDNISQDAEPSPELLARIRTDWISFKEKLQHLNFEPNEAIAMILHPENEGDPWHQVAHDFVMTRNHTGVGFWDGDWLQPWGKTLTDLCLQAGELELYIGDDNLIYPY